MKNDTTLLAASVLAAAGLAQAQITTTIYFEDFEGVTLGPNVDEIPDADAVFSRQGPLGWTTFFTDPVFGDLPEADFGVTEWRAFAFVNKDWWVTAAGDQQRGTFATGLGTVLVADPDEWDDATVLDDNGDPVGRPTQIIPYNTTAVSGSINLAPVTGDELTIEWDQSFRSYPYTTLFGPQNPFATADMEGVVTAVFNVGGEAQVANYLSVTPDVNDAEDPDNPFTVPTNALAEARPSYSVAIPAGATSVQLAFNLRNASNDWWWAIDNIAVIGETNEAVIPPSVPQITAAPGLLFKPFGELTPETSFEWVDSSAAATFFNITFYSDAGLTSVVTTFNNVTDTTLTVPAGTFAPGRVYFTITAVNNLGTATTEARSFDISQDSSNAEIGDVNDDGFRDIFDILAFFNIFAA